MEIKKEYYNVNFDSEINVVKVTFIKDTVFTKELAIQAFSDCNDLTNNKPYFLISLMFVKLLPNKEVYDFYSSNVRSSYIMKECFILNSPALRFAANFYFKVKKPSISSKVFSTEKEGMLWLIGK